MAAEVPQTLEYGGGQLNDAPMLELVKGNLKENGKVKAKLALISSSTSAPKSLLVKNKALVVEAYEWDEEDVSSNNNEMVEVKVLMSLADDESVVVGKESARNEQRNNLLLKHRDLIQELNTCKEQLLVLKQAKLDFLIMHHANTEILKENQNLRKKLKELTTITETWLNISNKFNQCISEQLPNQKKRILRVDQLTEDPSSSGQKDLVFVKSSADDTKVSILGVERPCATEYDSADESLVYNTHLPPLEKLAGAGPVSGPKTVKSILKARSNVDHTRLISKSIFVTNFPDNTTSKDLWEVCKGYGTVVDVFISDRKSKAGKRFAFVRFIKVENVDRLVGNLCTLWIGRMHLHANIARFDRPPIHSSRPNISTRHAANGASSFASVLKGNPNNFNHIASSPAMVLDDECVVERDLDNFVMGKVKDFSSINNLRVLLSN
ncbi:RNA-directed DNA polymerase, eukaryota, nucleotide-binding alpha-beta plait domain protein [Tanacetum coccineum]|uniref:RNA-directed DNA polymerase, eukaryota, nucleotide-binding alpha-beta plait domain protein n=1 Tax=Tanacetum coccineum TaxID=301880 RepID=A0ABQ4ZRF1_9ASTR